MITTTLRIGTRRSALARAQSQLVLDALGVSAELVPIVTAGDSSAEPLTQLVGGADAGGGTGVFVSALREALLSGEIDAAVHSFKDLPTAPADGITVAGVPEREDPRDALVARDGLGLAELPAGARVGTGSPRRAAQLRALGLGLEVVGIRGNVDTRLGKVTAGELDAVVLALAGLRRLGRAAQASELLDPLQMMPAPAQGALALECRADDAATAELLRRLDHSDTRACVAAERAVLAELEAGCSAPIGALALVAAGEPDDSTPGYTEVFLRAVVAAVDGSDAVRLSATGPTTDADAVGRRLAADLLANGADRLMGSRT